MKSLITRRLLLRPLNWDDLEDLHALYSRPELMQYITGRPRTREETRRRLARHIEDHQCHGFGLYAVLLKSTGLVIGRCGLEPVVGPSGLEGDLAWMFHTEYWGQGLATEFAHAAIAFGLETLALSRVFATADRGNLASIRVMQKAGMRPVRRDARRVEYEIRPGSVVLGG